MATAGVIETNPPPVNPPEYSRSSYLSWIPWRPTTSDSSLAEAEKTVLKVLRSTYEELHVPIGPNAYIHTVVFESEQAPSVDEETRIPLVMIHGFGCGIPQFYKNFDHLHSNRKLYAIDLPGFARSTRVNFTPDAEKCEQEFVDYIEKWREGVGLEKFILLGHSLGAFLSCAYAMRHPSRVRHLILDDPWGFPERPPEETNRKIPFGFVMASIFMNRFNPFTPLRAAGPIGPYLVCRFRPDLARIFGTDFMNYVYHSNVQSPTGEDAFYYLQLPVAWAKRPMLTRIDTELDPSVPISFVYGNRSWMNPSSGEKVRELRPQSYVRVYRIMRAGHHVHADKPEEFNQAVNNILKIMDRNKDVVNVEQSSRSGSEGGSGPEDDNNEVASTP